MFLVKRHLRLVYYFVYVCTGMFVNGTFSTAPYVPVATTKYANSMEVVLITHADKFMSFIHFGISASHNKAVKATQSVLATAGCLDMTYFNTCNLCLHFKPTNIKILIQHCL